MYDKIVVIIAGIYLILAGLLNWGFFFDNYMTRRTVNFFSRKGARIFYTILGAVLIILAIAVY